MRGRCRGFRKRDPINEHPRLVKSILSQAQRCTTRIRLNSGPLRALAHRLQLGKVVLSQVRTPKPSLQVGKLTESVGSDDRIPFCEGGSHLALRRLGSIQVRQRPRPRDMR